jgi:hydroxyacylglutathione hydrolase
VFLHQYYLGCLAHASYLLADEATGTAIVVDPQRDIQQYLADAERHGFTIRHVFLTHFHADFVAGHLELRDRCGATIHLGASAKAEYAFVPMRDGDALTFPGLRIEVLETPGHTIESISLLVFDLAVDADHPHAVLTGDTLFIGDVGRPDLRASLGWTAADLGAHLYDSLHQKLLPLPDATLVYPAHGAGSLCGKNISSDTVSTLGEQRRFNYALRPMTREQFIQIVTADQPDAPAYFTYDAVLNTRERATLDDTLLHVLRPIPLAEFLALAEAGAQVVDVRIPDGFARGHLRGSINIGLDGQFATWAGTVLDANRPILLIAPPGRETEAALRLGRIGFDQMQGYLAGGMEALADRPELIVRIERRSVEEIAEALACVASPLILDVRSPREYATKHIAGSTNVPLSRLRDSVHQIPPDRHIYLHCAGGYRSSIAASLLAHAGRTDLTEMAGGLAAWEAAGQPVVRETEPAIPA